jgi:hypothetical protein
VAANAAHAPITRLAGSYNIPYLGHKDFPAKLPTIAYAAAGAGSRPVARAIRHQGILNLRVTTFARLMTPLLLGSALLNAQATRTWVSGVGDDANPCSRTAPCKTFAGAISKTAAGGEINAIDPGGYGTVSGGGLNGVRFLAGKSLRIENCNINGFTQRGIDISTNNASGNPPTVSVINTTSNDNGDSGIRSSITKRVLVSVVNSCFNNNGNYGVYAGDLSRFSVNGSNASGNGTAGYIALANAGDVVMNVSNSTATNNSVPTNVNGTGVQAGGGSATSIVRLYGVAIMSNFPNGMVTSSNGSIVSFGHNANAGTGAPTSTIPLQ